MYTISLSEAISTDIALIGGKAKSLALLQSSGFPVPESFCITTKAYSTFLDQGNLREKIALELSRKKFDDMRWEEIWDAALRIRNLFVTTELPAQLEDSLKKDLQHFFGAKPVAVRSSSPEEDTAEASFAGLHESFLNVSGIDSIIDHVKKVWASLWSDAALLYRQEIGLHPEKSSIAVLVQEIIASDVSGVMFSRSPDDNEQLVIEAVYGLNQGLVDGTVEPDRWYVRIQDKTIGSHYSAQRENLIVPAARGVVLAPLPAQQQQQPPLTQEQVFDLAGTAIRLENYFGKPQDVEWTLDGSSLFILQSRPITTGSGGGGEDKRPWYLSLRRSFDNLQKLQMRISQELLPEMDRVALELAAMEIEGLSDDALAEQIRTRNDIHAKWVDVYWTEFIPFAHGMRLFGQVYNDRVKPDDPYEFINLLSRGSLASIRRNELLFDLAEIAASNDAVKDLLTQNRSSDIKDQNFHTLYEKLLETFGDLHLSLGESRDTEGPQDLVCSLILKMAAKYPELKAKPAASEGEELEKKFIVSFADPAEKEWAQELLSLGRASYTFRDDDNIYLGRIEKELNRALHAGRNRLQRRYGNLVVSMDIDTIVACLQDPAYKPQIRKSEKTAGKVSVTDNTSARARQLLGQPAGPGIARGKARVVTEPSHLKDLQQGEILVCDSIDPNMTFIVPLVGGIVERRGGMLIHGAIIAREYGLACVTGIPDAIHLIMTGDTVTVDGYLGIVTISHVKDPLA